MAALLRQIVALCLLRIGPQDLPYSTALTARLVLLLAAVEYAYAALLGVADPLPRVLLSIAVLLAAPWLLLALRDRRARYPQTLAALAGSGLLFTLAFLPLALLAQPPAAGAETSPPTGQLLLGWLALLVLGWKLMINAHIYRHALDWPRFSAMMLVVALFLIEFGLYQAVLGGAPPADSP